MRPKLSEALGIPVSNIQVAATHTHAGPYVWLWEGTPPEAREYLETTLTDGMIDRIEKELGFKMTIVATGGLSKVVIPHCNHDITIDKDLVLKGLYIMYQKNKI